MLTDLVRRYANLPDVAPQARWRKWAEKELTELGR